ncbi:hypothetical protein BDR03DRAFT_368919 [Suillus americanus]|nr:hypothetical protein BDR03DRAFT_368919 [Suillus americanus]
MISEAGRIESGRPNHMIVLMLCLSLRALLFYVNAEAGQKIIYFRFQQKDMGTRQLSTEKSTRNSRTPHNRKLKTSWRSGPPRHA